MFTKESSPFESSPLHHSPRLFWKEQTVSPKGRFGSENEYEPENAAVLSPKRSSIENLKKASRVKNSNMFAREQKNEYDPTQVKVLDRPLAAGRPLATQVQGNAFGGSGLAGMRKQNEEPKGHRRGESLSKIPTLSPTKTSPAKLGSSFVYVPPKANGDKATPPEGRVSPTKSSLASPGRFTGRPYNPDSSFMSSDGENKPETPRPLRRHAKSVTFDAAPPIINEYEMVTPDPSVTTASREGSYDSEDDFDDSFDQGSIDQDDSFDASLEDSAKTPVMLPEDWRHMSPDAANTSLADTFEDPFDGRENSPMPTARPNALSKPSSSRNNSFASDGESRPLPPLPGMEPKKDRRRRNSSIGLSNAAERASDNQRSLPQLPQAPGISKSDIMNMREASMSLEDRLNLMGLQDRDTDTPTQESPNGKEVGASERDNDESMEDLTETEHDGYQVQKISRDSILRRVKSRNFDDYEFSYEGEYSPERSYGELADLDPDIPIPSREVSSNFDETPRDYHEKDESESDSVLDAYSMAETTEFYAEAETSIVQEDYEGETSVIHHEIKEEPEDGDDSSEYSPMPPDLNPNSQNSQGTIDSSGPPTPKVTDDVSFVSNKDAAGTFPELKFDDSDLKLQLDPYNPATKSEATVKIEEMREFLQRPQTPDTVEMDVEEPSTPDSVIRHPIAPASPDEESVVPERAATIKAPGAHLKTRPSLTPADTATMAATRRQVSGQHPPPIPERSPKRNSLSIDISNIEEGDSLMSNGDGSNKENRCNKLLDIPIEDIAEDLSFGLDKEFENIIEAQKVDALFPIPHFANFPASECARTDGAERMCGEGFVYTYSPTNGYVREQKGYLMRQNTKIVVASNRQFSDEQPPPNVTAAAAKEAMSANASSRKPSNERKPWTKEPWNGKARRRSIRTTSGSRRVPAPSGPAPPLPGQESAVVGGADSVEDTNNDEDDFEDGAERGRLFVKVVGVKDLDLPLPKSKCNLQVIKCNDITDNLHSGTHMVPAHPGQRSPLRNNPMA